MVDFQTVSELKKFHQFQLRSSSHRELRFRS